jgi:hypothetical protein
LITENLSTLKIHKLTKEQYERELEAGRIDENALYLTPNEDETITDITLSVSGKAADAKTVGDAISNLNTLVGDTSVSEQINSAIGSKLDGYVIELLRSDETYTHVNFNWADLVEAADSNKYIVCRTFDPDRLQNQDYIFDFISEEEGVALFFRVGRSWMEGIELWQNGEISVYGQSIVPDDSLTKSGYPADAKAVGDAISNLNTLVGDTAVSEQINSAIAQSIDDTLTVAGNTADAKVTGDALNQKLSIATTEGTGEAYTVTIPNVGVITDGFTFIMIPHVDSTSISLSLTVNGIRGSLVRTDNRQSGYYTAPHKAWLKANHAYLVTKGDPAGAMWLVNQSQIIPDDIIGSVAIEHGGTGAATVTDALSNLGAASNPNQLDNWYFADPINQRGATTYTTTGFTIDRWKLESPSTGIELDANLTLNDGYITIAAGTTQTYFKQKLERFDYTKTYTLSVMLGDGTISYITGTNSVTLALSDGVSLSTTHYTPNFSVQLSIKANTSIDIKAIKLEYGSVSTLANDEPPKYSEQLLECQRYFIRFASDGGQWLMGASNGTTLYAPLHLPVPMRVSPTFGYSNVNIYPYVSGGKVEITSLTLAVASGTQDFMLYANHASNALETKQPGCIRFTSGGYIELSAEIAS